MNTEQKEQLFNIQTEQRSLKQSTMDIVRSPALRKGKRQLTSSSMDSQITDSDLDSDDELLDSGSEEDGEGGNSMATPVALFKNKEGLSI